MLGYGICRFMVEFIREPDVQLGYLWGGWLTMGQVLSVPLILVGIGLLVYAWKQSIRKKGLDTESRNLRYLPNISERCVICY